MDGPLHGNSPLTGLSLFRRTHISDGQLRTPASGIADSPGTPAAPNAEPDPLDTPQAFPRRGGTRTARVLQDVSGYYSEHSSACLGHGDALQPKTFFPIEVCIPRSTLVCPPHFYKGESWRPPANTIEATERTALRELLRRTSDSESEDDDDNDFVELDLDEFVIYGREFSNGPWEMKPLHHLSVKNSVFYAAGVLSSKSGGPNKYWVTDISFRSLPIGNYGPAKPSVDGQIWISSDLNGSRHEITQATVYYRLGSPATAYIRYYTPFVWVADLAKHFVDFLEARIGQRRPVSLHDFRSNFAATLQQAHGSSAAFRHWYGQRGSADFRSSVIANQNFLWKEACGALGDVAPGWEDLDLWREVYTFDAIPRMEERSRLRNPPAGGSGGGRAKKAGGASSGTPETIVTEYTHRCFRDMPFGWLLTPVKLSPATQRLRDRWLASQSHVPRTLCSRRPHPGHAEGGRVSVRPGDVVALRPDDAEGSHWKIRQGDKWYALVQRVNEKAGGGGGGGRERTLDVIWLYTPAETPCGTTTMYTWKNELFVSNHCNCKKSGRVTEEDVLSVHGVMFGGSPNTKLDFFVRQTYFSDEKRWVTWEQGHNTCVHLRGDRSVYGAGDAVLAYFGGGGRGAVGEFDVVEPHNLVEPCELVETYRTDRGAVRIRLRRFLRRTALDPKARPNELVYTDDVIDRSLKAVHGKCTIRCFPADAPIPAPYDRNGVGNLFFIRYRQTPDGLEPVGAAATGLRQGFDPGKTSATPKLRGLDLFCGGGNFGRGLEEGGAVKMKWANDYWDKAIHTYMANQPPPPPPTGKTDDDDDDDDDVVNPFHGSIDDLQLSAIKGKFSRNVPRPGDVDFISGGSPCPGFSSLTNDKTSPRQRKNQSLLASFVSAVDLYRPKLGLLENVTSLIETKARVEKQRECGAPGEGEASAVGGDPFGQMVAALVGLGYQVQMLVMAACRFGSPQRRHRVFIFFAAPGCRLPEKPRASHPYSPHIRTMLEGRHKVIPGWGLLPNGGYVIDGDDEPAAFPLNTAAKATRDLPPIYDATPAICIPFPDHRQTGSLSYKHRIRHQAIPVCRYGQDFASTFYADKPKGMSSSEWRQWRAYRDSHLSCFESTLRSTARSQSDGEEDAEDDEAAPARKKPIMRMGPQTKSWGRVHPHGVFETVVTSLTTSDAKNGRWLHWSEPRAISLMEARRAQGFRDDEVLLGTPKDQWKIVGNSVAREVALSLGLKLREAWLGSLDDDGVPGGGAAKTEAGGVQSGGGKTPEAKDAAVDDEASSASETSRAYGSSRPTSETPDTSVSNASSVRLGRRCKRPRDPPDAGDHVSKVRRVRR